MAEGYPWLEAGSQGQAGWDPAIPEEARLLSLGWFPGAAQGLSGVGIYTR